MSTVTLAGMLLMQPGSATLAQSDSDEWSTPVLLFETEEGGRIFEPVVNADKSGTVHVFWNVLEEDIQLIYYTRWDGVEWTPPLDIMASEWIKSPYATIDTNGMAHLLWSGSADNRLLYSRAPTSGLLTAKDWDSPDTVDKTNPHSQIVVDSTGRLHRVYGRTEAAGPYYQTSEDGGVTWSLPVNISPPSTPDSTADFVRLAISDNGTLHVAWTEFALPVGWPPIGVFYANSVDGGKTWSELRQIAGDGYTQINVAAGKDDTVHVAWNGMAGVHGRYHRWSSDGGQNWSETFKFNTPGTSGSEGPPSLVVDSAGNLHLITSDDDHVWYFSWENQRWTDPVNISGPKLYLESPTMTLGEGNRLHVIFWTEFNRLWYTTKLVSAPAIPPVPFPTEVAPTATALSTVSPTPPPTSTPEPTTVVSTLGDVVQERGEPTNPGQPIVLGILPVVLLIGGIIVVRVIQSISR